MRWYTAWKPFSAGLSLWLVGLPALSCELTVYPVAFGLYSGQALATRGEISLSGCPRVRAHLDRGLQGDGRLRYLSDRQGNRLGYLLYQDSGHTRPWDNEWLEGDSRLIVYGYLPGGQYPPPGDYADTVTVTVEW